MSIPPPIPRAFVPRQSVVSSVVCWMMIALAVAAMFASAAARKDSARKDSTKSADGQSPQFDMVARYTVGISHLLLGRPPAPTTSSTQAVTASADENRTPVMASLLEVAKAPAERLDAAIVAAEVQSPAAGEKILHDVDFNVLDDPALAQDFADVSKIFRDGPAAIDGAARQRLIDRRGWAGKLAVVRGLPDSDPLRREALAPAERTVALMAGIVAAGAVLCLAAAALFITAIVLLAMRSIRPAGLDPRGGDVRLLEAFAIYLVLIAATISLPHADALATRMLNIALLPISVVAAIAWPMLRGLRGGDLRAALGVRRGRGVAREMLCGIGGYLALLPIMIAGIVVTVFLTKIFRVDASHPIVEMFRAPLPVLMLVMVLACAWAPITEELMFRGAFFGHLNAKLAWPLAALIVAVIFAAIHPQGWAGIPVLAAIGFNLAVLRYWRGSLIASVTAHAMNNSIMMIVGILFLR